MQVVNVAMGGTLVQDMPRQHRHVRSELALRPGTAVHGVLGRDIVTISCYHHQALDRIGAGLRPTASSEDGVVEAIELTEPGGGWFLAVQWHPEDTAADDPAQQRLFGALVSAAAQARSLRRCSLAKPIRAVQARPSLRRRQPRRHGPCERAEQRFPRGIWPAPGRHIPQKLPRRVLPQIVWTRMISITSFV